MGFKMEQTLEGCLGMGHDSYTLHLLLIYFTDFPSNFHRLKSSTYSNFFHCFSYKSQNLYPLWHLLQIPSTSFEGFVILLPVGNGLQVLEGKLIQID